MLEIKVPLLDLLEKILGPLLPNLIVALQLLYLLLVFDGLRLRLKLLLLQNCNVPKRLGQLALLLAVLTFRGRLLPLKLFNFDAEVVVQVLVLVNRFVSCDQFFGATLVILFSGRRLSFEV